MDVFPPLSIVEYLVMGRAGELRNQNVLSAQVRDVAEIEETGKMKDRFMAIGEMRRNRKGK